MTKAGASELHLDPFGGRLERGLRLLTALALAVTVILLLVIGFWLEAPGSQQNSAAEVRAALAQNPRE